MARFCVFLAAIAAAACGVLSPEQQLLMDFFEASRLNDTTVVARFSSVTFNPRDNGVVQQFNVDKVARADDGQSEEVTVTAQVRDFSGRESPRQLVFTLRQRDGRWFIADLRRGAP